MEKLIQEAKTLGKSQWRPMLEYVAKLHRDSIHPPRDPFPHPWEEIGPGYCYAPAFGHWDIVHQVMDSMQSEPKHVKQQLMNNLAAQEPNGHVPGSIWLGEDEPTWSRTAGHPPVWPIAVQDYVEQTGDQSLMEYCYEPLQRLIEWFNQYRKAEGEGYYYTDILNKRWESGVDEGVRFDDAPNGKFACVDATAHVYWLYQTAYQWSMQLGQEKTEYREKAKQLAHFMQTQLYDEQAGFFYDIWSVNQPEKRSDAFEGIWPVITGAATAEQANRVIDGYILNPNKFFTTHPLATVAADDKKFELRMWRGPAWNSMVLWAARGCCHYNREDAASKLLERALDASAKQFARTGTIWEFYHPHGGRPEDLQRKPDTEFNRPCRDYLGHNPMIAMARLWESTIS